MTWCFCLIFLWQIIPPNVVFRTFGVFTFWLLLLLISALTTDTVAFCAVWSFCTCFAAHFRRPNFHPEWVHFWGVCILSLHCRAATMNQTTILQLNMRTWTKPRPVSHKHVFAFDKHAKSTFYPVHQFNQSNALFFPTKKYHIAAAVTSAAVLCSSVVWFSALDGPWMRHPNKFLVLIDSLVREVADQKRAEVAR